MSDEESFKVHPNGAIEVTLRPKGSYEVPIIKLYYDSVEEFNNAATKEDGAEIMKAMRNASGMAKALELTYSGREAPPAKTQGKPEGANTPSPQVEMKSDPFQQEDDAPPFGDSEPEVPSCKHGKMKLVEHSGKKGYVCASGLPKENPERCASIML